MFADGTIRNPDLRQLANTWVQTQTMPSPPPPVPGDDMNALVLPGLVFGKTGDQSYVKYNGYATNGIFSEIADPGAQLQNTDYGDLLWQNFNNRLLFAAKNSPQIVSIGEQPSYVSLTITSGAVVQASTARYSVIVLYVYATTSGTAGTVTLAIGPSSTPTADPPIQVSGTTSATATQRIDFDVEPGYYYSVTLSGVTVAQATMKLH
jgi:hypothetical protein